MKHLLALIALAALILSLETSNAQTYAVQTITVPNATAGTNLATKPIIDCRKQQNVALTFTTASTNCTYYLDKSVDAVDWVSYGTVAAAANTVITNINIQGVGYLRLNAITNVGTIVATNTVKYAIKIGAP